MDFRQGGKGVGIGKVCEGERFEVGMPTYLTKDIIMGVYGEDTYRYIQMNRKINNIQGALYYGAGIFASRPCATITVQHENNGVFSSSSYICDFYAFAPSTNGTLDLGASGNRWRTVYSINALNTSDEKYKENIEYLDINSDTKNISNNISQEDIYKFYKDIFKLSKYNYKEQDHKEYGFIAQDLSEDNVGKTIVIDNEEGYMYSVGSYISTVAGALQYEINLRDKQIKELTDRLEKLEKLLLSKE